MKINTRKAFHISQEIQQKQNSHETSSGEQLQGKAKPRAPSKLSASLLFIPCLFLVGLIGCSPDPKITGHRELFLPVAQDVRIDPATEKQSVNIPQQEVSTWPQDYFSAQHALPHISFDVSKAQLLWTAEIGKKEKLFQKSRSNMVFSQNQLFCTDASGTIIAFDVVKKKILWKQSIAKDIESVVKIGGLGLLDDQFLLVTLADGRILKINKQNGKIEKSKSVDGMIRSAPCILPQRILPHRILIQTNNNSIFALNEDLKILWRQVEMPEDVLILGRPSPASDGGIVLSAFSTGEIKAYDLASGNEIWADFMTPSGHSSLLHVCAAPVIQNNQGFVLGLGGRLFSNNIISSHRTWNLNLSGQYTPATSTDWLFVIDELSRIFCINSHTGKAKWISNIPQAEIHNRKASQLASPLSPLFLGGCLMTTAKDGSLVFFDLNKGTVTKTLRVKGMVPTAALAISKKLFVLSKNGNLYVFG